MKLDPRKRPTIRSCGRFPALELGFEGAGGSWSTPALARRCTSTSTTAAGRVLELDRATGAILWERQIGSPAIAFAGRRGRDAAAGRLLGAPVRLGRLGPERSPPALRWNLDLGDCIESTPAVWQGWLYVGHAGGLLYGIADAGTAVPRAGRLDQPNTWRNCDRMSPVRQTVTTTASTARATIVATKTWVVIAAARSRPRRARPMIPVVSPPTCPRQSIPRIVNVRTS